MMTRDESMIGSKWCPESSDRPRRSRKRSWCKRSRADDHSVRAKDNARRDNSKVQGVDHVLDPWTTATRPTEANYEGPVCNRFIDILLKRIRASNQIFLIQEDKAKTRAAVRSQLGEGRKQRDSVGGPTATESLQFPFANEAPVRACQPALRVDVHVRPDRVRLRACGKL